jgi:putative tricarboxylic transport membrane protein
MIPRQIEVIDDSFINSRTFPYLLAFVIMAMSIKLIVVDLVKIIRKQPTKEKEFDLVVEGKAIIIFFILLAYVALMPLIGFLFSSILMFAAFLVFFHSKEWKYYLIGLLSCISVYIIFTSVLHIQLM